MNILVTGAAGFIGFHLSISLLADGHHVTGIDNINDYYDVNLKYARLAELGIPKEAVTSKKHPARHLDDADTVPERTGTGSDAAESIPERTGSGSDATEAIPERIGSDSKDVDADSTLVRSDSHPGFHFVKMALEDREGVAALFERERFDAVINLAAQAGVRYSLQNPHAYMESNITGFLNILEGCRHHPVTHLIYASSSSVYGANTRMPFSVTDNVDHPVSLYAASKKANELMAHSYAHLYGIPATGLRFFTVYGPWGRPDMAYFKFADLITAGKPIDVYNYGEMERDFTYIDDIVESVRRLVPKPPAPNQEWSGDTPDPATSYVPYQLFNIGHSSPVSLMDFITELERNLGIEAAKNMMDIQPGDVPKTWADAENLFEYIDYRPKVPVQEGIARFVDWYRAFYGV